MIGTATIVILASMGAGVAAGSVSGQIFSLKQQKEDVPEIKPVDDYVEM